MSQVVPINRTNTDSTASNKHDIWFNAFNYAPGQDEHIRWLSRPNQQLVQGKYSHDTEKFRITFDVENFKSDQIKIYVQNRKLTITGVYEERSENSFTQKQFERTFDLPASADVDSMAAFITPAHMLVVEVPLNPLAQVDHLNITSNANNQRRLSFSLNKFNTSNNQGLLSPSNDLANLSAGSGQQVRRTSITKTTTTTTTGSSALPPEALELLRSAETSTGNTTQTYNTQTTERRSSNTGNQLLINEPSASSLTTNKQTTLTSSDLENLPIDFPPELLASGGTITIQKRKVSITKSSGETTDQGVSVPLTRSDDTNSSLSRNTTTTQSTNQTGIVPITRSNETHSTLSTNTNTTQSTNQTGIVPITRSNETHSTLSTTTDNTSNQRQTCTTERLGGESITSDDETRMFTLEEFLQNKNWNPSLIDGPNGKKILYMRLQMKPGTTSDKIKISLNGYDFRVEVDKKVSSEGGPRMSEHSYHQVTLFRTCEIDQLTSELKDDGYLHVQVPIKL